MLDGQSIVTPQTLAWLVSGGSALATFTASVMGDEQNERLKNGTLGAVAGTSIGGLAGLMKGQQDLLVVGFVGSVVGAFLGWLVYLGFSFAASTPQGRTILEFQVAGLKGVRERLNLDDQQRLLSAVTAWRENFSRMMMDEKNRLLSIGQGASTNQYASVVIETWLISVVDFFALVFETLARKPKYQSRVTIIVFGARDKAIVGKHWISYSGSLDPHQKDREFPDNSIGYKVLYGRETSPFFSTSEAAKQTGQKRGDTSYRPFITFRLNSSAILALDWPDTLDENDPYVVVARNFFNTNIAPVIAEVLEQWHGPLQSVVELQPLPSPLPPPPAPPPSATPVN
jgi:hypothetical protein